MVKLVTWADESMVPLPLCQHTLNFRQLTVTVKTRVEPRMESLLASSFTLPEYVLYDTPEQEDSLLVRLIFANAHVPYETKYVDEEDCDFYGHPFSTVPMIEINGLRLGNLNTICRHLAWRYDLAGLTASDDAVIDFVTDAVDATRQRLYKWIRIIEYRDWDDYEMEELEEKARRCIMHFVGPAFEEMLRKNGGEWIVGNRLSWADLAITSIFNTVVYHRPSFFDRLPLLYNHCKRVAELEGFEGLLYNVRERSFKKAEEFYTGHLAFSNRHRSGPSLVPFF